MSEKAKHTAGPWHVERQGSGIGWLGLHGFFKDRPDALVINMPFPPFAFGRCGAIILGDDAAELEANARLIAAAPELLESSQRLANIAERNTDDGDEWFAAIASVRAAIEKATGKEAE